MVSIDSRFLHRNVLARVIRFQSLLSVVYLWYIEATLPSRHKLSVHVVVPSVTIVC